MTDKIGKTVAEEEGKQGIDEELVNKKKTVVEARIVEIPAIQEYLMFQTLLLS